MNEKHRQTMKLRRAVREEASRRVEAVWACVGVLCPELPAADKAVVAEKFLKLSRGEEPLTPPRFKITPAQVTEMVWRNMQCIQPHCSMMLFAREIADELNEFFNPEEQ